MGPMLHLHNPRFDKAAMQCAHGSKA